MLFGPSFDRRMCFSMQGVEACTAARPTNTAAGASLSLPLLRLSCCSRARATCAIGAPHIFMCLPLYSRLQQAASFRDAASCLRHGTRPVLPVAPFNGMAAGARLLVLRGSRGRSCSLRTWQSGTASGVARPLARPRWARPSRHGRAHCSCSQHDARGAGVRPRCRHRLARASPLTLSGE